MRLTVEIQIDERELRLMAEDWIDRLKHKQKQDMDRAREETRLRLHVADVIKAKLPAFWTQLKTCIATDCAKLRQEFPNDLRYHCTLDNQSDIAFRLINTIPPRVSLIVEYHPEGQCIDITESNDFVEQDPEHVIIGTTDNEEIIIRYRRETISAPRQLAEHLCRRVAQI